MYVVFSFSFSFFTRIKLEVLLTRAGYLKGWSGLPKKQLKDCKVQG